MFGGPISQNLVRQQGSELGHFLQCSLPIRETHREAPVHGVHGEGHASYSTVCPAFSSQGQGQCSVIKVTINHLREAGTELRALLRGRCGSLLTQPGGNCHLQWGQKDESEKAGDFPKVTALSAGDVEQSGLELAISPKPHPPFRGLEFLVLSSVCDEGLQIFAV